MRTECKVGLCRRSRLRIVTTLVIVVSAIVVSRLGMREAALAQSETWTDPVLLSSADSRGWFPDIAVDVEGAVHVVYDGNRRVSQEISADGSVPAVMYTVSQGDGWSEPNDLHIGGRGNIFRVAVVADRLGNLHMTSKRGGAGSELSYRQAAVDAASSAQAWSDHVLDDGVIYMSDIALDSESVIHVVYDKWVLLDEPLITESGNEVTQLADIFYRRSSDGGRTWSVPVNLSQTPRVGSYRVQLKVDANDDLHVTWDEGFDRWALYGEPQEGRYIHSTDGGQTWSAPIAFDEPEGTNAQIAGASDHRGGVLLVWRATTADNLFYVWSSDGGETWTSPEVIPGVYARSYNETPFDAYEMATDSDGGIHLIAVARPRLPASRADQVPLGVYHLVWDGVDWSTPDPVAIYEEGFPEYPRITVSEGNLLHTAWFVRDQLFDDGYYRIFYSSRRTDATYQTPVPTPTAIATPLPTPTLSPPATSTPLPTIAPGGSQPPSGLYTESDEVATLLLTVSPIALLVLVIVLVRLKRRR